jgi:predicted permease
MPEWKQEIRSRLASLKLEPIREQEIVDEISQHLDDRYKELIAGGATRTEASQAALAELDKSEALTQSLLQLEQSVEREPLVPGTNTRSNMLADLWQDLRFGARMLGKHSSFTVVVVVTLALGIGVNTAVFTLFNLFLRPLPVRDPDSLVRLEYRAANRWGEGRYSLLDYIHFRDNAQAYSGLAASQSDVFMLDTQTTEPQRVLAMFVSDNFLSELGAGLSLGRTFTAEENRTPGQYPVALLSYYFWQRQFSGDPEIVGRTLRFHRQAFTVIGVTAREFIGLDFEVPDVWLPLLMRDEMTTEWVSAFRKGDGISARDNRWLDVYGRLKPGVTLERANAEADLLMSQLIGAYPEIDDQDRANVLSAAPWLDGEALQAWAMVLLATLSVLLIACTNVANLLLARAIGRQKEIGIRLCLGASRRRLIRQLLAESVLLACLGGAAGLLLAWWSSGLLTAQLLNTLGEGEWRVFDFTPDLRVLGFTLLLSLSTGVVFGLAPALRATRVDLVRAIRDDPAGLNHRMTRSRLRRGLVVTQVSLCMILLGAAGLLLRALIRAGSIERGFETRKVLAMNLRFDSRGNDNARRQQIEHELAMRLESLPGVQSVSRTSGLAGIRITVPASGEATVDRSTSASCYPVTSGYFDTLSIPIVSGRRFTEAETRSEAAIIVVSETTARNLWPNQDPLGKTVNHSNLSLQVIGVARDAQNNQPGETPSVLYYRPLKSDDRDVGQDEPNLLLRTESDLDDMKVAVRAAIQAFDPALKLEVDSLAIFLNGTVAIRQARAASQLTALIALLALSLACTGIYGVMSHTVNERTREIGIRMALGAQPGEVMGLVLRQGLKLVLAGVVLGTAASLVVTRVIISLLFGLSPTDPLTYGAVATMLILVAMLACWIPAKRATRVDPMVALRYE